MIISYNIGGISNRLKAIASGFRLGKHMKKDVGIKWDILDSYERHTHILNCSFNKLFSNDIEVYEYGKDDLVMDKNISHCLVICDSDGLEINFNNFTSGCAKQFTKSDKLNRNIDFMYNKIPIELKCEYIEYFKILKPIECIQTEIDDFSKNFDNKTVSVHIRSWNRNGEGSRRDGLYNIEKYLVEMRKYDDSYKFYLATDSSHIQSYLSTLDEFKDRIFIYPRKTNLDISRDIEDGVQEDLIELYLLSKNKYIVGSHFSTYTEVAWWLSGCISNIVVI